MTFGAGRRGLGCLGAPLRARPSACVSVASSSDRLISASNAYRTSEEAQSASGGLQRRRRLRRRCRRGRLRARGSLRYPSRRDRPLQVSSAWEPPDQRNCTRRATYSSQISEAQGRAFTVLAAARDLLCLARMRVAPFVLLAACASDPDVITARQLPAAIQADAAAVVAANNQFACDVYGKVAA